MLWLSPVDVERVLGNDHGLHNFQNSMQAEQEAEVLIMCLLSWGKTNE